ncbi:MULTISPECIES: hypothetical protein [unclassified Rhizobium]|uniref:hypothetical protein n=1 Tax=unclassified Rhizobium TaxID=2613769 RepID=UPI00161D8CF4|nr:MULTISPECIES: hypothetical protein [unclassified Rhizobium]MBB3317507.1 nucleoid-associated protein YgaU [Rhizobium sp. BK181]MBB3543245.1 nucleoid-associated protein YgaU [Rhizobium sp. BK399]MCS3741743.1 nucleoid-associated protein YgaU [Rhizobium sp. BK661]MCS4093530.1 nucleoid-associated protein YgaU [Rhizobium sp. BK176]
MFFRGSRYESIPEAQYKGADGRVIRYKRMRFIPATSGSRSYVVGSGDRPDLASASTLGDPERFWQLCDINRVMRPVDLTDQPGTIISVPSPGDLA